MTRIAKGFEPAKNAGWPGERKWSSNCPKEEKTEPVNVLKGGHKGMAPVLFLEIISLVETHGMARLRPSRKEQVGRHAKVPRQGAHMIEGEVALAAQNHRAQRPVNLQQSGEVRRRHAVRVQQVL